MEKSTSNGRQMGWRKPRFGIFERVLLSAMLVTIIPIAVVGYFAFGAFRDIGVEVGQKTTDALNERTIHTLERQAFDAARQTQNLLTAVENDLRYLSHISPDPHHYLTFAQSRSGVIWSPGRNWLLPLYKEVAFSGMDGVEKIRISEGEIVPGKALRTVSDPAATRYGVEAYFSASRDLPFGEIFVSRLTGFHVNEAAVREFFEEDHQPFYDGVIRFAAPLWEGQRRVGVVTLALDHRHLQEITAHIAPLERDPVAYPSYASGNYAFMFDDEGWIITHPKIWDIRGLTRDGRWVAAYTENSSAEKIESGAIPFNLDSAGFIHPNYPEVARRVRSGETGTVITQNVGGTNKIMAFSPIRFDRGDYGKYGIFGGITVGAEVQGFYQPAHFVQRENAVVFSRFRIEFVWLLGLSVLFTVLMVWLVSRQLAAPIISITRGAREIARGDLDKRIEFVRQDEIGELAASFNRMSDQLARNRNRLLASIEELRHARDESREYAGELEYQVNLLTTIQRISNALGTTLNHKTLIRQVLSESVNSIGFDRAILYLLNDEKTHLEYIDSYGFTPEMEERAQRSRLDVRQYDCIETRVVKSEKIVFVENFDTYPEATELDRKIRRFSDTKSFVFVPLRMREKVIGILGADRQQVTFPISENDINSLQILANQVSRVIEITRLYADLLNQRAFMADVFKYMRIGLVTIDSSGRVININRAACRIFNLEEAEEASPERAIFLDEMDRPFLKQIHEKLCHSGPYSEYNAMLDEGGEQRYLNINASFTREEAEGSEAILIIEDVTENKVVEDQISHLEKLASLGRFAASIAHEIRNPLTGISLFMDDLHDRISDAGVAELLQKSLSEIERLEKLTHEILVYAHPTPGDFSPADLTHVLMEVLSFLRPQLAASGIELVLRLPEEHPCEFLFHRDRMRQALLNIAINAIEVMKDGGRLTVRLEKVSRIPRFLKKKGQKQGEEWISLRFEDTGPGIEAAERGKIFEPFYTRKSGGTGLGLATTYNIISEHGGGIVVEDARGHSGAVFILYLPVREAQSKSAQIR